VEKLWILNDIRSLPMNVWKQVLHRVEQVVDRSDYDAWFASTRFVAQKGDTLDVAVPSQRHIDEIRERYGLTEGDEVEFIAEERGPYMVPLKRRKLMDLYGSIKVDKPWPGMAQARRVAGRRRGEELARKEKRR